VGTALCDADRSRDVPQANPGVVGDAEQNMGVVREEVPASRRPVCRFAARQGFAIRFVSAVSRNIIHESMLHYVQSKESRKEPPNAWDPDITFPCGVTDPGCLPDSCGVTYPGCLAGPDRIATIGEKKMTILNSQGFKRFILGREVDVAKKNVAKKTGSDDSQLPLPGYDRIKGKDLISELPQHSQAELAAIETYERSHKKRVEVFDKLRYLRGPEPLQDYDALSVEQILAGLEGADIGTLQRTRLYERKFQRRPDVLENVAAAMRELSSAPAHHG
jgi:hypothetical protein